MKAALEIGAELDFLTPEEYKRDQAEREQKRELFTPRHEKLWGAGQTAAGNLYILPEPYGPPAGYLWHVMSLQIVRADGALQAHVGRGDFYIGPTPNLNTGQIPANALADIGGFWEGSTRLGSLPDWAEYQEWQHVVRAGNGLWFVISAPAAAVSYVVKGSVKVEFDRWGKVNP